MRTLLIAGLLSLLPTSASAQTWQEWVKQNPTYPSLEKPATVVPAANSPGLPALPDANALPPGLSTKSPEFEDLFMQGCIQGARSDTRFRPTCACALKQVQNNYTIQEVAAIGQQIQRGTIPPDYIRTVAVPCASFLPR